MTGTHGVLQKSCRAQPLFTARMDGDYRVLDARGDLLLRRRVNALDVPRAEVRRLTGVPE